MRLLVGYNRQPDRERFIVGARPVVQLHPLPLRAMLNTLSHDLRQYEDNLAVGCKREFGVSLKVFKTTKAVVQLAAILSGIVAIQNGADPLTSLIIIAAIYGGPEYLEYFLANQDNNE